MSTGEVARRNAPTVLIEQSTEEFAKILPSHVRPEVFARLAVGALRRDPALMDAATRNLPSLMHALMEAARLGLEPGTKEYYLTPRGGKQAGVVGIVGYQGEIELIYRAGAVSSVKAELVHRGDRFAYTPSMGVPEHEVDWFGDRGEILGAYAYAHMAGGGTSKVVVVGPREIKRAMDASPTSGSSHSPWKTDYGAMVLKGLALDTLLPTANGWTTMEDVEPGSVLFDRYGSPCTVTAKSEVKHLPCYRVTLRNGASIVCDEEHRWVARTGDGPEKVWPVADLAAAKHAGLPVILPANPVLELPDTLLPLDPWTLGYWLGNGDRSAPRITCGRDDADAVESALRSAGLVPGKRSYDGRSRAVAIGLGGVGKVLAEMGVLGNKHAPDYYLWSGTRQRRALLAGLMDSDGTVSRNRAVFTSTDRELRDAVVNLARSLGENPSVTEHDSVGYGHVVRTYCASWTPVTNPFTLPRKAGKLDGRRVRRDLSVTAITRVDSVPTACIAVDSPSQTYLCGQEMVPTHNTAVHQLAKWVPTSAEFRRELLRASAEAQAHRPPAASGAASGSAEHGPRPAGVDDDGVVEGELVDEEPLP